MVRTVWSVYCSVWVTGVFPSVKIMMKMTVSLERIWKRRSGGALVRCKAPETFFSCPCTFLALNVQITCSRFSERFCVRQYIFVSLAYCFLFYSRCIPSPAICKSGGHVPPLCPIESAPMDDEDDWYLQRLARDVILIRKTRWLYSVSIRSSPELCFCRWRIGPLAIPAFDFSFLLLALVSFTTEGDYKDNNNVVQCLKPATSC